MVETRLVMIRATRAASRVSTTQVYFQVYYQRIPVVTQAPQT